MIFQCWDLSRIVLVPLAARSRWMPRCPCACVPSITYESSQLNHDVCRCTTTSLSKAPVAHSIIQSTISCRSLLIFIDVCVGETYKTHKQSDSKSCSEVEWPKWPKATPIVISACNQRKSGAAGQLKAMERTVVKLTVKISGLGMHWDGLYIVSLTKVEADMADKMRKMIWELWDDMFFDVESAAFYPSQEDHPTAVKYTNKFGEESVQMPRAQLLTIR